MRSGLVWKAEQVTPPALLPAVDQIEYAPRLLLTYRFITIRSYESQMVLYSLTLFCSVP
jgi:hypothetical protein